MKMKYTVDVNAEEPIMLLNKHFGMDEEDGEGIMGDQFQSELMYLDTLGKKRIKLYINSPGGSVLDGMKMYQAVLATKTKVDTYNGGVAASMAGVLFQAGRTRYMSDYALLMLHNPSDPDGNNADPQLQAFKGSLIKMLMRKSPQSTEEGVSDLMNNTTWMNADNALSSGFCDVIENSSDMNKPRAVNTSGPVSIDAKATWKTYANYFNSINTKKQNKMLKVTNYLKLNDSANEESIMNAIEGIQNKATAAVSEKEAIAVELTTAKADLLALQNKVNTLEAAAAEAKTKEDAEKVAAIDAAATLLVENAAKIGKIKNDSETIKSIKAQAIKNFEGTKALIEAMPLNKIGANIVDKIEIDGAATPKHTMAGVMVEINNRLKK